MTEDDLFSLYSTDELFDMMLTKTNEVIYLDKIGDKVLYEATKAEIQLLQKVIVLRKAIFKPLHLS